MTEPIKPETTELWLKRLNAEVFAAMTNQRVKQAELKPEVARQ